MTLDSVKEVELEIKRFQKRLEAVKKRAKTDTYTFYGCSETGALKRAAADLKVELTKLTR